MTSLPGRTASPGQGGTPGAAPAAIPGTGAQVPSLWASPDVPIVVKPPLASLKAAPASIFGRAVFQGAGVVAIPSTPGSPAGQVTGADQVGLPAVPATPTLPATAATPANPAVSTAGSASGGSNLAAHATPFTPAAPVSGGGSIAIPLTPATPAVPGTPTVSSASLTPPASSDSAGTPIAPTSTAGAASDPGIAKPVVPTTSAAPALLNSSGAAPTLPASPAIPAQPADRAAAAATVADPARVLPRAIRHGGPSFGTSFTSDGHVTGTGSGRGAAVAPVGGSDSAGTSTGGSDTPGSTPQSETAPAALAAPEAPADAGAATASAAASALAGVLGAQAPHAASSDLALGAATPVDLADAADRLMSQAVQTIHTFQTSAGPSLEARISDPALGDVRVIVTGRAGEIVQAQLVVRDRVTADAITAAAARMHTGSDALAGVSVTVRSESGGSATNSRAGGNPFEAAGWAAGSGYGTGGGPGANGGHGQGGGLANQNTAPSGNGTEGGSRGNGTPETQKQAPAALPGGRPTRPTSRTTLPGGSSLDVRA